MAQAQATAPGQVTAKQWVYLFEEGLADMRDLLGGKGAGLRRDDQRRPAVPPGFTITTEACSAYYEPRQAVPGRHVGAGAGRAARRRSSRPARSSATRHNPLLVSVRSGAKFSMPGMMDTVLNLGLNDETRRRAWSS